MQEQQLGPELAPDGRRIRVLYLSPGADARGGAERSLLGLVDGLDRAAVEPSAIVFGEGSMVDALRSRGVPTTSLPAAFRGGASYGSLPRLAGASAVAAVSLLRSLPLVREAIRGGSAEVVHSNGIRAHLLLPMLRRSGVATVASIRELPRSRAEAVLLRGTLRAADATIATSDYVSRRLSYARDIQVINNPISAPDLPDRAAARVALGLPSDAFVVAMLAHFHWWKGHLDLLRAVEPLEDVWLILAGGDLYGRSSTDYRDEVLSFAQARGFAHRVRCTGAIDDVGPVYAAADVVAHCSVRPEPFGRVLVEAMLSGKPVVASTAGAPGEFIKDSRTGLLFAPGDTEKLRRHLITLLDHPEARALLSRDALIDVADRFDPARHATRVLSVYQSVSRRRGSRGTPRSGRAERMRTDDGSSQGVRRSRRARRTRWSRVGRELGPTLEGRAARYTVSHLGLLNVGQRARGHALASALGDTADPRLVYDVGCGRGVNTLLLARRFPDARVVGIDIDPDVLDVARHSAETARMLNVEFELSTGDLAGERERADLVVCIDVLEHLHDDERFAAEVSALVAGGGDLIVHVPLRDQHYLFASARNAILGAIREGRDPHVREGYSETDLRRFFSDDFGYFQSRKTLGGVASVVADIEALSSLRHSRLLRIAALLLLPYAGSSGGRWSKGVLAVGRDRLA